MFPQEFQEINGEMRGGGVNGAGEGGKQSKYGSMWGFTRQEKKMQMGRDDGKTG